MNIRSNSSLWKWLRIGGTLVILVAIAATYNVWWPRLSNWVDHSLMARKPAPEQHADHDDHAGHAGHDENAPGHVAHTDHDTHHDAGAELELSAQARKNLGLTEEFLKPIQLSTYYRKISMPARIVMRPGRSLVHVSTPLTGVITHVHAVPGESVTPGTLLFEIRLTHEDLVKSQTEFLVTLGEIEVENREITRLAEAAETGGLAKKTLLEHKYKKEKLETHLQAQREALRLHGLAEDQIEEIVASRRLLRDLQIVAPAIDEHEHPELRLSNRPLQPVSFHEEHNHASEGKLLEIEELRVRKGQAVAAGEQLCTMADFSRLYIEGQAFEQDARVISVAAENHWTVRALFPDAADGAELEGLKLAYVSNQVDRETRTLPFFVDLPNQIVRDTTNADGQRHIAWKFRPGQRLQLEVPVEEWTDQIVLPIEAVVKEGANWYVFHRHGDHFDQVPVHVQYRDQRSVVITNDGSIHVGDTIAMKAAHQMLIAIKNKSGGAIDPHAGHTH